MVDIQDISERTSKKRERLQSLRNWRSWQGTKRDDPWVMTWTWNLNVLQHKAETQVVGNLHSMLHSCSQSPFIQTPIPQTQHIWKERHTVRIEPWRYLSIQEKYLLKWQQENYDCLRGISIFPLHQYYEDWGLRTVYTPEQQQTLG